MDSPLKPGDPIELKEVVLLGDGVGAQGMSMPHEVRWIPGTVVAVHSHKISVLLYNGSARRDVPRFQTGLWQRVIPECDTCKDTGVVDTPYSSSDPSCPDCDGEDITSQ